MQILNRIKERAPRYNSVYETLISKFTVIQGGLAGTSTKSTFWEQGKYFSTKYEIFMYALLLGLKKDYSITSNNKTTKFIEIKSWQPMDIADYIIMAIIAKSGVDLNELELLDKKAIEFEILKWKKLMEEYANGGFDIIRAKLEDRPEYFENNDNCFIDLLDE